MSNIRILQAVLPALTLVLAACAEQSLGGKFDEVSEAESGLQFYGPGLEGGYRSFLTGETERFVQRTVGQYGPKQGNFPLAVIFYTETPPDRYFTRGPDESKPGKTWDYFSNRTILRGPRGTTVNGIGRVEYMAFTADGISCVNWVQVSGSGEGGSDTGTMVLAGFYCKGPGPMMSDREAASIVRLVGHRDRGPIKPVY